MRTVSNRIWTYIGGVNGLLLILYSVFVFSSGLILYKQISFAVFVIGVLLITALSILLCPKLLHFLSGMCITVRDQHPINKVHIIKRILIGVLFFSIPFVVFLIYYLAYYPGGYDTDCINQYYQMYYNDYNDWHPVIQTLLTYKLPFVISRGWVGSIVLFQILFFSSVLGYSFNILRKYTNTVFSLVSMMLVLLNPQIGNMVMFPFKDIFFSGCCLLLLTFSFEVCFSKGLWMKKTRNIFIYVLAASLATLSRHNALLFTIPLILATFLYISKKRVIAIALCVVLLCLFIKYPFYSTIGIKNPDNRLVEVTGVPMTIIGAAITYTPDAVDDETKEFAYAFSPKEVWDEKYYYGGYNAVKWDDRTNVKVVEEYGIINVISMMLRCINVSPKETLISFLKLTDSSYTLTDKYYSLVEPYVYPNVYNIQQQGNESIRTVLKCYGSFAAKFFPHLFMFLGSMHYLLIASVLSKFKLNCLKNWRIILFVIPVFLYNYITTLLLSTYYDAMRFFLYTFILMPILLAFLFGKTEYSKS